MAVGGKLRLVAPCLSVVGDARDLNTTKCVATLTLTLHRQALANRNCLTCFGVGLVINLQVSAITHTHCHPAANTLYFAALNTPFLLWV